MVIKRLEDIEREKQEEKREKLKKQITEDARDVIEGVFGGGQKKKQPVIDVIWFILKSICFIIAGMIILNLILGNIWLFKFFAKEFFGLGV